MYRYAYSVPPDDPAAPDPEPENWWLIALGMALLYLVLLTLLGGRARADSVPERFAAPVEGRGNRGLPELRDPPGASRSLPQLLRSCARCHGPLGPNRPLFDAAGLPLWDVPRERLQWGTRVVLNAQPGARWYPNQEERRDLRDALRWLSR